ncbi:GxxExxY protein [Candidatus Wolfebacteria bacterium]|uniref:GxxExxY protein n=1 Tax=Candidatus Wolfebacteria bacterium CG_4_10_14_0_2_um_filter_39_18 TaxID=1975061 RepID=A0A2M7TG76_9BACT|nr:GxxExxY protein [Candidatus Wolfebacteria bacterium]PIZ45032.1 MAG: GxxExxY protein [Candidatus Wolfebacteria bacterium CG_4_10_14_0_2_um_filter_39_18]
MPIMRITNKLIYPDLSYKINGVFFMVHNELGRYCNEKQYADALESGFKKLNIVYEREKILPISFDGEVEGRNKVDFVIENKIIIEIKAKNVLSREEYYQIMRYLRAFNKKLGLLVNFRDRYLRPKRILKNSASSE